MALEHAILTAAQHPKSIMRKSIAMTCTFALLLSLSAATAPAGAQSDTRSVLKTVFPENIERELAVSAAPEHLRAGATVYIYGAKGFTKVQAGKNGFTCLLNRDGFFYNSSAFKPTCWDAEGATSYVPVMLRVGELLATGSRLMRFARRLMAASRMVDSTVHGGPALRTCLRVT